MNFAYARLASVTVTIRHVEPPAPFVWPDDPSVPPEERTALVSLLLLLAADSGRADSLRDLWRVKPLNPKHAWAAVNVFQAATAARGG